jgi:hypothetical protein
MLLMILVSMAKITILNIKIKIPEDRGKCGVERTGKN